MNFRPRNLIQASYYVGALVYIEIQDYFLGLLTVSIGARPKVGDLSVKSVKIDIIESSA
jgi:hypothetical protein